MNIIFYRYKSICEPDYIDAFKKLGVTVIEDNDGWDSSKKVPEKMVTLGEMIAEYTPLFVFSINFFPFISMVCERLRLKYVAETVDCPVTEIYTNAIRSEYNRVFLFDRKQYESLSKITPQSVRYLPLGAAAERTTSLLGNTDDYKYDVSFVGSLYNEKDPYLDLDLDDSYKERFEEMIRSQISECSFGLEYVEKVFTKDDVEKIKSLDSSFHSTSDSVIYMDLFVAINEYIGPHIAYLERLDILNEIAEKTDDIHLFTLSKEPKLSSKIKLHKGAKSFTEMPFVFRQSKINLNITMRSIQTGIPQRVWDVLACKGFLITNDQPEISDYFEAGKHLEVYKDKEELLDKIDYYLKHDKEREKIAENGYNEVCQNHLILLRVINMIKNLE